MRASTAVGTVRYSAAQAVPIHQRGYSAALGTAGAGLGAERSVGERLTQEYSQYLFGAVLDDHRIELLDDAAVNEDRVGDVQRRLILAELNLHRMQRTTWLNLHIMQCVPCK